MEKKTIIPDEVIQAIQRDVAKISHGTVTIHIQDSNIVQTEVSSKRKYAGKK